MYGALFPNADSDLTTRTNHQTSRRICKGKASWGGIGFWIKYVP